MNGRCVEGQMKEKKKKWILDILTDIAGGLLLSIAIYSFAVPADFPMTSRTPAQIADSIRSP